MKCRWWIRLGALAGRWGSLAWLNLPRECRLNMVGWREEIRAMVVVRGVFCEGRTVLSRTLLRWRSASGGWDRLRTMMGCELGWGSRW